MKKYIFSLLFLSVNFLAPFRLSAQPGQQLDHQKNYNYCLHGYSGCDSFSLTDAERTQVQQAARQRNYNSCVHGYAGCDSSQLTDAERTQVQRAARQRNYNNCLHGYAGCDSSQLTETERAEVQQAAHQRNYNNCLHAYFGCNPSLLTDSEKESIAQSRNASPTKPQPQPSTGQSTTPRYYTNKDGERVQSPTYSDTIPVGATAQCRDGTYSFSRNHRGTCSHHGGVAKWLD